MCKYYNDGSGTRVKWITLREDTEEILQANNQRSSKVDFCDATIISMLLSERFACYDYGLNLKSNFMIKFKYLYKFLFQSNAQLVTTHQTVSCSRSTVRLVRLVNMQIQQVCGRVPPVPHPPLLVILELRLSRTVNVSFIVTIHDRNVRCLVEDFFDSSRRVISSH